MDIGLIIKLIATTVGVIGAAKVIYELRSGVQNKLREEFKFAKEFLEDIKQKELHPYTVEKGYQAIAGSTLMTKDEVEYILSISDPVQRLNDYKKSFRMFNKFDSKKSKLELRKKYNFLWYRRWLKGWYFCTYFTLSFAALSPFLASEYFGEQGVLAIFITLPSFGIYAWAAMNALIKVAAAERLIANQQDKHSSPIEHSYSIA